MTKPSGRDADRPHVPVLVVGGGQAGLSVSHYLGQAGIDHLVLEQHAVAHNWRTQRWDSFCLVTPNWQCRLPGFPYPGDDPDGFMLKDDIVRYIEDFRHKIRAPVREGVAVTGLARTGSGGFWVATSEGEYSASSVVLAVSGYHRPKVPRLAERLPSGVVQIHSSEYRRPDQLPPGAVLVVGTGQSGCQIAEDLHLAGRSVHLSLGSAPRSPRRYRGRDAIAWLHDMGQYALTVDDHSKGAAVRRQANHYMTGRDGGREIDLRRFALEGMALYGRLGDIRGSSLSFAPDLKRRLDAADEVYVGIRQLIDRHIAEQGLDAPGAEPYVPCWEPEREPDSLHLEQAGITGIIWSTGFVSDWSWVDVPIFDGRGYPSHKRGITPADGLYLVGLPWLHTWGSGRFSGVAEDAEHIVKTIVARTVPAELAGLGP